ncbi:MAG: DUF1737 domain-containing protein [Chitinivibrionales bacterium]|nr:DUF1737 domain-containing protein [Chitinivibrionales bacterium]
MEYKIVQSYGDAADLEKNVNQSIRQGWQLYGDFQVTAAPVTEAFDRKEKVVPVYCQAMTRE